MKVFHTKYKNFENIHEIYFYHFKNQPIYIIFFPQIRSLYIISSTLTYIIYAYNVCVQSYFSQQTCIHHLKNIIIIKFISNLFHTCIIIPRHFLKIAYKTFSFCFFPFFSCFVFIHMWGRGGLGEGLINSPHFPTAIRTVRNNIGFFYVLVE
jgi:hypothetical protein